MRPGLIVERVGVSRATVHKYRDYKAKDAKNVDDQKHETEQDAETIMRELLDIKEQQKQLQARIDKAKRELLEALDAE